MDNKHIEMGALAQNDEQVIREKIKHTLDKNALTQVWLINRLREKGLSTDKTELSSALSGVRRGEKINIILRTANHILEHYEKVMQDA